ncbi:MAG TPA: hypothetical protein VN891_18715, partial [Steroidobacteraceae bacterium]|nr:hypothetical protein [Steroidobacteraceae bacterium]
MRALKMGLCVLLCLSAIACGGSDGTSGGGTPPPPPTSTVNTASVIIDGGPSASSGSVNTMFTTVTVCVPGSTT